MFPLIWIHKPFLLTWSNAFNLNLLTVSASQKSGITLMLKQTFYHQINTKRGIQVNLTKNPSLENASISDSDRKPINRTYNSPNVHLWHADRIWMKCYKSCFRVMLLVLNHYAITRTAQSFGRSGLSALRGGWNPSIRCFANSNVTILKSLNIHFPMILIFPSLISRVVLKIRKM